MTPLQQYLDAIKQAHQRFIEDLIRLENEFLKSVGGTPIPIPTTPPLPPTITPTMMTTPSITVMGP